WSDKTLESLKKIFEQPSINWNLLEDVFNIIIDIPVRMDSNRYVFAQYLFCTPLFFFFSFSTQFCLFMSKTIRGKKKHSLKSDTIEKTSKSKPDIEAKPDVESEIKIGVEIEAKGEKQETNEAKNPEEISDKNLQTLLIHHLEHCFLCIPWLSLLTVQGEKKPKILIDLEIFVKESLHKLMMTTTKTRKMTSKTIDTVEKYKEFVHLKELYVTVSVHYKFDENRTSYNNSVAFAKTGIWSHFQMHRKNT
ncbi:hypothetical protein RFI_32370, partial [Reticulomyxa filosa]